MQKAMFTEENRCYLCPKECMIFEDGHGFCKVRKNIDGVIYSLNYGYPVGFNIDPIEKKPLYHFYPGERILSIGCYGCNLDCEGCQNSSIARDFDINKKIYFISPKQVVNICKNKGIKMIAFTYTEPTVFFEYMYDIARLCKLAGIKTVMVSNGYIKSESILKLIKYIDAFNIDLKYFDCIKYRKYCKGELSNVLQTLKIIYDSCKWLEITNLIIDGLSDDMIMIEDMCRWIKKNLSKDVPIHFSAFYGMRKMQDHKETRLETLKKIKKIALKHLDHVYLGNVNEKNNTVCKGCKKILIKRDIYKIYIEKDFSGYCDCGQIIKGSYGKL